MARHWVRVRERQHDILISKSMPDSLRCMPSLKHIPWHLATSSRTRLLYLWICALLLYFNLKVGFIYPFVVIDPTDLGATTELLFQALYWSILNLTPMHKTCPFTYGNKAGMSVVLSSIVSLSVTSLTRPYRMLRKNPSKA